MYNNVQVWLSSYSYNKHQIQDVINEIEKFFNN